MKFIDFTNDGYTRTNRRKARSNLRDNDRARERYQEVADLVRFGRHKLSILTHDEYYEGTIDSTAGDDWNQSVPIDIIPKLADFKETVGEFLAWEVSRLIKNEPRKEDERLGKMRAALSSELDAVEWGEFNLKELFGPSTRGKRLKSADRIPGSLPFVTAGEAEAGISAYIGNKVEVFKANTITIDMFGSAKYRSHPYGADDHIAVVHTEQIPQKSGIFLAAAIHKVTANGDFSYSRNFYAKYADAVVISLPAKEGAPDYMLMAKIIAELEAERLAELEAERLAELEAYVKVTGSNDVSLTAEEGGQ